MTCRLCGKSARRMTHTASGWTCDACSTASLFAPDESLEIRQAALLEAQLKTKREMDLVIKSARKLQTINGPLFGGQEELF